MTNKDITKIYFRGNEIVALYQGSTLIFKKSGVVPPKPTGVYTVRGTVNPFAGEQSIQLCVNGKQEQFNVNSDNTFEHTFVNVPVTNMGYFTQPCRDKLRTLDLSEFDTSQVTSMYEAFYQCNKLEEINLTNVDTSNVTDMTQMFSSCSNLTSLDLSSFNTSNVTDMSAMFNVCRNLTSLDLSSFNTSNVTSMKSMFNVCRNLTSLDLSNFDTSNVMNMQYMFYSCSALTSLDLSNFDTSNVMNMQYMFGGCDTLVNLYINFDTSNVTVYDYFNGIFNSDIKLENVVGKFEGAKVNLNLSDCPLTSASAMVFINGLATVTEKRTLKLSATTYDSLTTEQIAIATSKGWTVTRN